MLLCETIENRVPKGRLGSEGGKIQHALREGLAGSTAETFPEELLLAKVKDTAR
jgi:hypothetical protein